MKSTEKPKFEDTWKKAFDGAEMAPPDSIWSSIEVDLAGQESAAMKKRIVLWQRLAAAMLVFGLSAGFYGYYEGRSQESEVRSQETGVRSQETASAKTESVGKSNEEIKSDEVVRKTESAAPEIQAKTKEKSIAKKEEPILIAFADVESIVTKEGETTTIDETPAKEEDIAEETVIKEETPAKEETVAVVSPLLQQTEQPEEIVKPKKRSRESNLWLALGASAGNYSPNTPSATSVPQNSFAGTMNTVNSFIVAAPQPKRNEPKVGQSYSFGMSVGKKFGRIVVQTGVSLGKQQVEYTSNYDAVTPSNSAKAASADYLDTQQNFAMAFTPSDYTINSTMEIISIPVQAGYMIIDRQIGWQFNAGVSPDFFLKNVLEDKSGQRERFTQSAGSASPYRSVNWSGLLNTELSYRLGQHYRLSLVPGVRYSFNSILKEPTGSGRPVILDLGFRFRYLFD